MRRRRLDAELIRRGLVADRDEAERAVLAGLVTVAGSRATNVGTLVGTGAALCVDDPAERFASRGGEKLRGALQRFAVDPTGRDCLDAGASTGGFTDCLLRAGARRVVAVDVGYGLLAWRLRTDERVTVLDRTNVRSLQAGSMPFAPSLVVADLSFVSLRTAVPALVGLTAAGGELVLLVKPQFELPPGDVDAGGVVRRPDDWRRALTGVMSACDRAGAAPIAAMASPILGKSGNAEFLLHARIGTGSTGPDVEGAVRAAQDLIR